MDVARGRAKDGFVDDVAGAVAAELRRRPVASAVLLGGSIVVVESDRLQIDPALSLAWVVSASFLVGAALAGPARVERWTWRIDRGAVVGLATGWTVGLLLLRVGEVDSRSALVAAIGAAFQLGFGIGNRIAAAIAVALMAVTLTPAGVTALAGQPVHCPVGDPALYAGWLAGLALLLLARRGRWLAALPFVMAAVAWRESVVWGFWGLRGLTTKDAAGFAEIFALAVVSVLLPVIAGRSAAVLRRAGHGDPASRLVVGVQRHRRTIAVVAFFLATALFRSAYGGPSHGDLMVTIAVVALLTHCAAGPSWSPGSFAPCVAAVALCVPLSFCFQEPRPAHSVELTVLPEAVMVLCVPLAVGVVVSQTRSARFPWWGWLTAAAVWVAAVTIYVSHGSCPTESVGGSGRDLLWCVVVALFVHAVATSRVSARWVLPLSPIVSFLLVDAFYSIRNFVPDQYYFRPSPILAALVAGPVAALLALAARRVRSMTALPDDHPVVELAAARPGFREA